MIHTYMEDNQYLEDLAMDPNTEFDDDEIEEDDYENEQDVYENEDKDEDEEDELSGY